MKNIISLIAALLFTQAAGAHPEHTEHKCLEEVTCVCETRRSMYGGGAGRYITGKGITVAEAKKNAVDSCGSQISESGTLFIVFNCLDKSLDNHRSRFFPRGDFRKPGNAPVYIKE